MKNWLIGLLCMTLIIFAIPTQVVAVGVTNDLPLDTEISVVGSLTGYTTDKSYEDSLISGKNMDLSFLKILKDKSYVDLSKLTMESDMSMIENSGDYSSTFLNATWNSATGNGTATGQLTTKFGDTEAEATFTSGGSNNYFINWRSEISFDENGDGDFVDSGDQEWLDLSPNSYWMVNLLADTTSTHNDTYAEILISFKTSGVSNYDVLIRHYLNAAGDTGWTNLDSSADNRADFYACDSDGVSINTIIPLAQLISEDAGDSPSIKGIDYISVNAYEYDTSKVMTITMRGINFFSSYPSITDVIDDDDDFDWRSAGGIMINSDDDNDLPQTIITEGATEDYNNKLYFLTSHIDTLIFSKNIRYIVISGTMAFDPTDFDVESELISTGKYKTTESISWDSRVIKDFTLLSNVLSYSSWMINMTLDDSVLWDDTNLDENLVAVELDAKDKTSSFRSVFEAASKDDEVSVNIDNPSDTEGELNELTLIYYTEKSYTLSGEGGVAAEGDLTGDAILVIAILVLIAAVIGLYFYKKRKGKKGRKGRGFSSN